VTERRERRRRRRRRKLLDNLKEEALDPTMWRAHLGRGFGPVVRQTAKFMKLIW
jgi:hypothetical protein